MSSIPKALGLNESRFRRVHRDVPPDLNTRLDQEQIPGRKLRARLEEWLEDPDLDCVRAEPSLAGLPEAERRDWSDLWSEVRELISTLAAR